MKRFFSLIILLALIPLSSALATDESDFIGTWVRTQRESTTEGSIVVYQIRYNHTVNYIYQKFIDADSPTDSIRAVYTWKLEDDSVAIYNGTDEVKRFYKKNDYTLSSDKRLYYGHYNLVLENEEDYLAATAPDPTPTPEPSPTPVPTVAPSPTISADPCGKWSFIYDTNGKPHPGLDFTLISADLFIMPDGLCYMVLGTKEKNESSIDFSYSDGIWIGDNSGLRIKTKDKVFSAYIDAAGFLQLQFTDSFVFAFSRIVSPSSLQEVP